MQSCGKCRINNSVRFLIFRNFARILRNFSIKSNDKKYAEQSPAST